MVELTAVSIENKEILNNLMEKYLYVFSQWDKNDIYENVFSKKT